MTEFSTTFIVDEVEVVAVGSGETPRYKLISCENPSYGYVGGSVGSYPIVAIGEDFVTVESNDVLTPSSYSLNAPSYLHGTQSAVNAQITQTLKGNVTYPLIYLQEIESDVFRVDPKSKVGKVAELHLWFMVDTKPGLFTDDKHDAYCTPMQRLAISFIKQIELYKSFETIKSDYSMRYHTDCGSQSETAYLKSLFTTPTAGVEVRLSLPVTKNYCTCN